MKLSEQLQGATKLFLDTAPVVYYIEEDERYLAYVDIVFDRLDAGNFIAVASPITLAECLVVPIRNEQVELQEIFLNLILKSDSVQFFYVDDLVAQRAAQLRAQYNLALPDALQAAVALATGCDTFLTNDFAFKRVEEMKIIILDEYEPE